MTSSESNKLQILGQIALFSIVYFFSGMIGLEMQSAQTGITPFWPPSGVALAAFVIFGFRLWPGVYLGMGMIAYSVGVPLWVAFISATGSILEVIIPLFIVQKYGFKTSLNSLHHLLLFLIVASTGPIISATLGSLSFVISDMPLNIPIMNMFFTWWLGNSFGMLLFGSSLILLHQHFSQQRFQLPKQSMMLLITILASAISFLAFQNMTGLNSALILNLMIPLVILSSFVVGFAGTLIPVAITSLTMVTLYSGFPAAAGNQYPLGIVFLDIMVLWVITLTGLLVTVAYKERITNIQKDWMSTHDGLTGLNNRFFMENKLKSMCSGLRQNDNGFCLLYLDLNDYKTVNEKAGHQIGDEGLVHVAKILKKSIRTSDFVARWTSDKFIILLPDCPTETSKWIAKTLNAQLAENPFVTNAQIFHLEFSIGIACAHVHDTPAAIIDRADKASHQAKQESSNIVTV